MKKIAELDYASEYSMAHMWGKLNIVIQALNKLKCVEKEEPIYELFDKEEVIIYGSSDDLIEIEGSIREEFSCYDEKKPRFLAFSDGTVLSILYDNDGIWKIRQVAVGKAEYSKKEAVNPDRGEYSDKVTLKGGNIEWAVYGREFVYKNPMREKEGGIELLGEKRKKEAKQ